MTMLLSEIGLTPECPVIRPRDPVGVAQALTELYDLAGAVTLRDVLKSMELVFRLLSSCVPEEIILSSASDPIERSLRFMQYCFDQPLQIADIADSVNLDRSYLSKLFRKQVGCSPKQWLTAYRMQKAAELLRTTDYSVGDIALSVSYDNQMYFSRSFRSYMGTTPTAYRNHAKNEKQHS